MPPRLYHRDRTVTFGFIVGFFLPYILSSRRGPFSFAPLAHDSEVAFALIDIVGCTGRVTHVPVTVAVILISKQV